MNPDDTSAAGARMLGASVRFGLIGLGHHGRRYARHLSEDVPGARLSAVCRRDAEAGRALAASLGARFHADYERLLDDPEVDAVVICSPTPLHLEMALAAARRRKPVLLEKPAAATPAGVDRILAAARDHGTRLMVAQTLRFEPLAGAFRDALAAIGAVRSVQIHHSSPDLRVPEPGAEEPAECRGVILDTGVHYFDLLGWFFAGRLDTVRCEARRHGRRHSEDAFASLFSGPDLLVTLDVCRATAARSETWTATGEKGTLEGDRFGRRLTLFTEEGPRPLPLPDTAATLPRVLVSFLRSIAGGEPFEVPGEDARRSVAWACACTESAQTGKPVTL